MLPVPTLPSSHLPLLFWLAAIHGTLCRFFVKSEYNYVGGELSVGMLATPLTLSAAALSWIPWLNFNRCSTMWIRQGDLAVLFHCIVRYACLMPMSSGMFVFIISMCLLPAKLHVACSQIPASYFVSVCSCLLYVCVCAESAGGHATSFNSATCEFSLGQLKGMSCP